MTKQTIDIHAHFLAPGQPVPAPPEWVPQSRRREHACPYEQMVDFDRIVEASDQAGIDVRILDLPASSRFEDFHTVPPPRAEIERLNEYLADGVREHPRRLRGFATIDAFSGDAGAAEVRRAVEDLELSGVVVDSARADVFLGAPETIPVLEEAARLDVPVFVHPTTTSLTPTIARQAGQLGNSFGRGLANGMALLTMVEHGVFERIGGLRTVFTTLGLGALAIIGSWRIALGASVSQWEISFDTMGFDASNVAYLVSVLGARRVLLGTDFPHQVDGTRERVAAALDGAGLPPEDQARIRAGNAADLLARRPVTHAT